MNRFTAEFRGGDNGELPWEWCVVDEEEGLLGSAIYFNLTESEARAWADIMNELHKDGRINRSTIQIGLPFVMNELHKDGRIK